MRLKVMLLAVFLSVFSAAGQFWDIAFSTVPASSAPGQTPDEVTGYPLIGWWVMDDYTTNNSVAQIADKSSSGFNLTNSAAASTWPAQATALNAHAVLQFDGSDDYLNCANYASAAIAEVFVVCKLVSYNSDFPVIFDSLDAAHRQCILGIAGSETLNQYAGALSAFTYAANNWLILDAVFTGDANATVLTNNITAVTGSAGTQDAVGLVLGTAYSKSGSVFANVQIAEMFVAATNYTSAIRTNLYARLKWKYGL